MEVIKIKDDCTGCGACASLCGNGAISMEADNLGFLYPVIDNTKCVKCGICAKMCPQNLSGNQEPTFLNIIAGVTKDEELLLNSSSGGAFTEIINQVTECHNDYAIYGASYLNGEVKHIRITSLSELNLLRKSKYTQSKLNDTFLQIKNDLKNETFVVFVGTPCQVSGLNAFLRYQKYENLLTIDLLCTGVCSPRLFESHVKYMEKKKKGVVSNYDMRNKRLIDGVWHIMDVSISYNNKSVIDKEDALFIGCFRHHVAFRESCYRCRYTNTHRVSDLTIGDYWNNLDIIGVLKDRGISVIISNTALGDDILSKLEPSMNVICIKPEDIIRQQPALRFPVHKPSFRYDRIDDIEDGIRIMKKYYRGSFKIRFFSFISRHIPTSLSLVLKNVYYGR